MSVGLESFYGGFHLEFVGTYKPGFKSHDLLWFGVLSMMENLFKKDQLQDLLSSLNAVFNQWEHSNYNYGHVIYYSAYITNSNWKPPMWILINPGLKKVKRDKNKFAAIFVVPNSTKSQGSNYFSDL